MRSKESNKKIFRRLAVVFAVVCMLASTLPKASMAESTGGNNNGGGDNHIGTTLTAGRKLP
ncbi:MAG: hypothetical protein IKZ98_03845 [Clostridia bacterium]|nr:hypothetical protein [Clostridia bacterium]